MSDFVTALREELVEAAGRERTRRMPRVHPRPRFVLAAAAAAAMALILLLAVGALSPRVADDERQATEPKPEARDLFGGTLRPGDVYRTRAFVPTLTFEVADREWNVVDTTQPDVLILDHGEGFFDPVEGVRRPPGGLWFTRLLEVYDPAVRSLVASLAPAPTDLHAWMQAHPDLRVGEPRPVTVAGVTGDRFDVEVRFRRPAHGDPRCREAIQLTCTALSPRLSFQDRTLLQVTVLRTEPEPLVIMLEHFTRAGLRDLEEAAAPVLESLRITRR
jgi:hypothetical protein